MGLLGDRQNITGKQPMPTQDMTQSTKAESKSHSISFADGAAGTTQQIQLTWDCILDSVGRAGADANSTSLVFTTGTVLTTEKNWIQGDGSTENDASRLGALDNGEFMVDYERGYILGKNAITTSSSTDTVTYNVRVAGSTASSSLDDVTGTEDSAPSTTEGLITGGIARTSQAAAKATGDFVRFVTNAFGEIVLAGYNWTNQNIRIEETDPISTHHVEDTVVDVTNGADGTYNYYLDMDGYSSLGLQLVLSGGSGTVTVTVETSIQDDGTAPASVTYVDVTSDAYGVASFTVSDMLNDSAGFFGQFKYVKVKVVAATGAADDADWTIYSKRKY